MKYRLLTILGLSASLFFIGCADEQARIQIADNQTKITRIEKNLDVIGAKVSGQKALDILNKIEQLQNQIDTLNGSLSTLKHQITENQNTQNGLYQGLDARLQAVENQVSNFSQRPRENSSQNSNEDASNNSTDNPKPNSSSAQVDSTAFQEGISYLQKKQFNLASEKFQLAIAKSSKKQEVAQAKYYLSICMVAQNKYKEAISTADEFIVQNPNNKKVPDALRIIYISQTLLKDKDGATKTYNLLTSKFPDSEATKKVQQTTQK